MTRARYLLRDDFYFLSDSVLARFKMFQGFEPSDEFPGYRLEQACTIWSAPPQNTLRAVLAANGFRPPPRPILPGTAMLFIGDELDE